MNPILDDPHGIYTGGVPEIDAPRAPPPLLGQQVGKHPTLNLGVMVIPYRNATDKAESVTTGDVAQWLERRYRIMEVFVRVHHKVIENALAGSVEGALEALIMKRRIKPFARGTAVIETRFKRFISSREVERVGIPGTPTHAALMGFSHRRKHPYARGPRRPSFRDTGLYMSSFKAWVS